jgi:hypothetical protein
MAYEDELRMTEGEIIARFALLESRVFVLEGRAKSR